MDIYVAKLANVSVSAASAAISQMTFLQKSQIFAKTISSNIVSWLKTPIGAITAVSTGVMLLWKGIETLQHKNEEAARVSRELADEEVENHQKQLSSLEELQKKLVSTGGDKQALAQIQNELNDAIGETPGLLNDESNAYEFATKKLWAKIEAEKAALKVSKMRQ